MANGRILVFINISQFTVIFFITAGLCCNCTSIYPHCNISQYILDTVIRNKRMTCVDL